MVVVVVWTSVTVPFTPALVSWRATTTSGAAVGAGSDEIKVPSVRTAVSVSPSKIEEKISDSGGREIKPVSVLIVGNVSIASVVGVGSEIMTGKLSRSDTVEVMTGKLSRSDTIEVESIFEVLMVSDSLPVETAFLEDTVGKGRPGGGRTTGGIVSRTKGGVPGIGVGFGRLSGTNGGVPGIGVGCGRPLHDLDAGETVDTLEPEMLNDPEVGVGKCGEWIVKFHGTGTTVVAATIGFVVVEFCQIPPTSDDSDGRSGLVKMKPEEPVEDGCATKCGFN